MCHKLFITMFIYNKMGSNKTISLASSAPHHGWQFKALGFNYATQTLYWSEATFKKIQVTMTTQPDINTILGK